MVKEMGAIIRNQIPSGRKSVLDAYGDILFRAWRDCTGACLYELENLVQASHCFPVHGIPLASFHQLNHNS